MSEPAPADDTDVLLGLLEQLFRVAAGMIKKARDQRLYLRNTAQVSSGDMPRKAN